MYHQALTLKELGHELTLVALNTLKHRQDPAALEHLGQVYTTQIDTTLKPWAALRNLLFGKRAYNIERFDSPQHHRLLQQVLEQDTYDLIQLEGAYIGLYLPTLRRFSRAPIVLRAHNVEYQIWHRMALSERNPLKRWYYHHLARRGRQFEQDLLPRLDGVVAITQQDADGFRQLGYNGPLEAIPAGIEIPEVVPQATVPDSIAFLGSLEWLPNIQGLEWFLNHVWPLVSKQKPGLSFHIAGKNPPRRVLEWNYPGIKLHGQVPDAHAYLSRYPVIISPLLSGSGMRIKLLESMAMGKAVVATSIAAEGIAVEDGHHLLLADEPTTFADAIISLFDHPQRISTLGEQARSLALSQYAWPGIGRRFEQFYRQLQAC